MPSEFGRAWGLSDRSEEEQAEVMYGVTLRAAAEDSWRGPFDPPRNRLLDGGWMRERAQIVAFYPGRTVVVNGLETTVTGDFLYEGRDGGWLERERLRFDQDHVLGSVFEDTLPGRPMVRTPADPVFDI